MPPLTCARRHFIRGSHAYIIMGGHEAALLRRWCERRGEVQPDQRWYERIAGHMPVGCYIVTLCYATAVILMGGWPWNILLILPVLLRRSHNPLRFNVMTAPKASVWSKLFCLRGGSL